MPRFQPRRQGCKRPSMPKITNRGARAVVWANWRMRNRGVHWRERRVNFHNRRCLPSNEIPKNLSNEQIHQRLKSSTKWRCRRECFPMAPTSCRARKALQISESAHFPVIIASATQFTRRPFYQFSVASVFGSPEAGFGSLYRRKKSN